MAPRSSERKLPETISFPTGTRDAVETAIEIVKEGLDSTWEEGAEGRGKHIPQWHDEQGVEESAEVPTGKS